MNTHDRIVIRRKKTAHAPHHGGAWKIAYADYMTAMMAFFLVMWLLSLIPKEDLPGIAEYFRTPLMTAITGGSRIDESASIIPGGAPTPIPSKSNPVPLPKTSIQQRQSPVNGPQSQAEIDADRRDQLRLEDLKAELEALIDSNPVLQQFRPQLMLDMTPDGLRIQIVDEQNRPMFATGRAQVQPYMRDILRELGPVLNKLPNSITISGHTDALQYAAGEREYSNWELSADRANAARKELIAGGMEERKVKRILGLSSSVSLIKDNPNAAVNRRISLLVLNRRAERRIDAQDAAGNSLMELKDAIDESGVKAPVYVDPAKNGPDTVPGGNAAGRNPAP